MIRVLLTKPRKKYDPVNGLLFYREGDVVAQAVIQERRNKTSKWEDVPIVPEEKADE